MKKGKFFCIASLGISFAFGLALLVSEPQSFSDQENRALAGAPTISLESITSKELSDDISEFYRDQFPLRESFMSLKASIERLLGRLENNSVIFADDGYLISRHDYESLEVLKDNVYELSEFVSNTQNEGVDVKVAIAPRAVDVLAETLPSLYPTDYNCQIYQNLSELDFLNGSEVFAKSTPSDNVWYKTDHHWTTHGAYIFYQALCKQYGIEAYSDDFFSVECVSENFYGTSYSRAATKDAEPDKIELYRYEGDQDFTVYFPTENKYLSGFYDFSALRQKDQYRIFVSGNSDIVQIRENTEGAKPKLLIIKDSFANSVVPFLALHFDIDLIDLRYYNGSLSEYISTNKFDSIAVICGIDTLATDRHMSLING